MPAHQRDLDEDNHQYHYHHHQHHQNHHHEERGDFTRHMGLFSFRALEVILAVIIFSLGTEVELPLPSAPLFFSDLGVTGPVIPLMTLFSYTAMEGHNMDAVPTLVLLSMCVMFYMSGIVSTSASYGSHISKNVGKFATGYQILIYLMCVNVCFVTIDLSVYILEHVATPKWWPRDDHNKEEHKPEEASSAELAESKSKSAQYQQ